MALVDMTAQQPWFDEPLETIGDNPALRREWAENRLQQIKRNGRSELDIVEEGLDMLFKLNQELTKGAWPQVLNNEVVSGEVRQTSVGLAGLWKDRTTTAEGDQSGPPLESTSQPQYAVPPAPQRDHGSSQVDRSARESEEPKKTDAGGAE